MDDKLQPYVVGKPLSISLGNVQASLGAAMTVANVDFDKGLSLAIEAAQAVHGVLRPSALVLGHSTGRFQLASAAIASLPAFSLPLNVLKLGSPVSFPPPSITTPITSTPGLGATAFDAAYRAFHASADLFSGTLAGLNSVAGIGSTIDQGYATGAQYPSALSLIPSLGTAAPSIVGSSTASPPTLVSNPHLGSTPYVPFGQSIVALSQQGVLSATQMVAGSYLASAASVFALESKYHGLQSLPNFAVPNSSEIAVGANLTTIGALKLDVSRMSIAADAAWLRLGANPGLISTSQPSWLRNPALELYTAAHAAGVGSFATGIEVNSDDEIESILSDAVDQFESRLGGLDPDLVPTYRGALEALKRGGTDWQRHTMVSFRELVTHVLHKLSPDVEVKKVAHSEDLVDGRPTRRARLNYIFAGVAGSSFDEFYEADMKGALELFHLLSNETHRLGSKATPDQARYLQGRLVGLVTSMLGARGY